MNSRRFLSRNILIAGFFFTTSLTSSAYAWTWNRQRVYGNPGICVRGEAGIDHSAPGSLGGNIAYSGAYVLDQACVNGLRGWWATTRVEVHRAAPGGGPGAFCRGSDWKSSYTTVDPLTGAVGPEWAFGYGVPPACGGGWYGAFGAAYVWDGSNWHGNWVWSGWEWVGAATAAEAKSPPPRPDWVDPDGTVNLAKAPKEVVVAGPDGNPARDANGYEKKVPSYIGVDPPPAIRAEAGSLQ